MEQAKCSECGFIIVCKGLSATDLITHLKIHKVEINKRSPEEDLYLSISSKIKGNQKGILDNIKRESLDKLLAKFTVEDEFSIHAITKSSAIKEFIKKRGYNMPKGETTVMKLITEYCEK